MGGHRAGPRDGLFLLGRWDGLGAGDCRGGVGQGIAADHCRSCSVKKNERIFGSTSRISPAMRIGLFLAIIAVIAGAGYFFRDSLTLKSLAAREVQLRDFHAAHPAVTLAIALLLYVAVTGLSIPGAVPLSLSYGWLFGFGTAVVLVSCASTTGACIAFLMSRYLIGGWVQSRFGERLEGFDRAMEKDGAYYLFTLRLVPAVPFFVINVVMGLTKIRLTTFWWVSQLGMLPATCILVWAGASAPSLESIRQKGAGSVLSWNVVLALVALGIFPLAARWGIKLLRRTGASAGNRR
jgi:uncharacterized membrane protein YdjX (TVP38/TMEM64 family)